jgi:hypothetical protein
MSHARRVAAWAAGSALLVAFAASAIPLPKGERGEARKGKPSDRVAALGVGRDESGIDTCRSQPIVVMTPVDVMVATPPGQSDGGGGVAGTCPQEVSTWTNASFEGGQYIVQAGFAEGEMAAASFILSPDQFPLRIDSTEMIFATSNATVTTTTKWSVLVFEGTPANGQVIFSASSDGKIIPNLVMPPGTNGTNIFFQIDPGDPDQIIVQNNGSNTFSVAYRIDEHNNQVSNPCFVPPPSTSNAFPCTDVGGLAAPSGNWLFAIDCGPFGCPEGWNTFAQLPQICRPSGDWVLRVNWTSIICQTEGACCLPGNNCEFLTPENCLASGGTYLGDNVPCGIGACSAPTGACCFGAGGCQILTQAQCSQQGGQYLGNNTSCGGCASQTVACCFASTGGCLNLPAATCVAAGGVPGAPGSNCTGYICFPTGACCLPTGQCIGPVSPESCAAQGGSFQGNNTTCAGTSCPQPTGGCCFPNGFCLQLTEAECATVGATWKGFGTNCSDANGNGLPDACEGNPADLNGDGNVNASDLAILLSAWGQAGGAADINDDGVVNASDLSILLSAWS